MSLAYARQVRNAPARRLRGRGQDREAAGIVNSYNRGEPFEGSGEIVCQLSALTPSLRLIPTSLE